MASSARAGLLALSLTLALLPAALAAQVRPQPGARYYVGTLVQGECKFTDHTEIATYFQRWDGRSWGVGERLPSQSLNLRCYDRLVEAGQWRMWVFDPDGDRTIKIVGPFTVDENPCEGDQTHVSSVSTPNGGTSGLENLAGGNLYPNQTLTANANTYLDFADGSRVAIAKGSSYTLNGCQQWQADAAPFSMKLSLLLGKIWSKIATPQSQQISTENVVCGNRGTIYWVSYDRATKQTVVHVDSGSVWIRANGRTITVKAGQTATKTGAGVPVVKAAPIGNGPPF